MDDIAELLVAGDAEEDDFGFAAAPGDWAGTGDLLNGSRRGEALAVVAELGEQGRLEQLAGTG